MKTNIKLILSILIFTLLRSSTFSQTASQIELTHLYINGTQYLLNINPPQLPAFIDIGDNILVEGILRNQWGIPVPNAYVTINDLYGFFSGMAQSDLFGQFSYETTLFSGGSIKSPRQIKFHLENCYDYKSVFIPITIPPEYALFSSAQLNQIKNNLNGQYDLEILEISPYDDEYVPLWFGPVVAPSYLTLNIPDHVNPNNYYLIRNLRNLPLTDPYYTHPEMYSIADYYYMLEEDTWIDNTINSLGNAVGYSRLGVYVGGGVLCAASAVPGLQTIGPAACGLIIKMAISDVIKLTVVHIMEMNNAPPSWIENAENTWDILGLISGDLSEQLIEGSAMGIDALILENEIKNDLAVINQAYWNNQSVFSDITIDQVASDKYFFEFDFLDDEQGWIHYRFWTKFISPESNLYEGTVNPNAGNILTTYYFSVYFINPSNQAPQYVKTIGTDWELNMTGDGINYSLGVQFTGNKTFSTPGTYSFYFEAKTASDEILRYPSTGYLSLTVTPESGSSPYPPSIELTHPNNVVCHDECPIMWNATDPDNNAVIYLYYDNNSYGENGTCINPNDPVFENSGNLYVWNTVNMTEGTYWIYATIDDGTTLVSDYSPGYVQINHPDPGYDFDYSSKHSEEDDGDGDEIIESGESFDLDVWIRNMSYTSAFNYVQAKLTTTNSHVTITNNDSYYGDFDPRENKKGDNDFDIQVDDGWDGYVDFQLNIEYEDEIGNMFYQVLDIPSIHIYEDVSPSFQVVDLQIIDDGDKCNNDGILNSGENSVNYKLKLLNNGEGTAYNIEGQVVSMPEDIDYAAIYVDYPDIQVGSSKWPELDESYKINSVPNNFTGIIDAELEVTWGDNGIYSQQIPFTLEVFPAPRIDYEPETYDFGIAALGDTAIIPVWIRNKGSADLIISQIENLSLDANNWISGLTFPAAINPDDTVFFNVNIKRDVQANVIETFRIHSNNHTDTVHDIQISGTFYNATPQGYVHKWSSDLDQGGYWVEPGNLDNDGLIDVVTNHGKKLYFWEQTAPNSLEMDLKFIYATDTITEIFIDAVQIGNCDGDNKTDIVITETDADLDIYKIKVFETSADNQYQQVWSEILDYNADMESLEVGNCNSDGNDEILMYGNDRVYVYKRTADNVYSETWNSGTTISDNNANPDRMGYLTTGDTDQDGKKEIILPGDNEYIFIWEKNSSGSGYTLMHNPLVTYVPDPDGYHAYPKVFDIDYDNENEIVLSGDGEGFEFSVFNPDNAVWTYEFHCSEGIYDEFSSPGIADLNGNGIAEVFLGGNHYDYRMIVYEYSAGSYFEIFASADFGDDIYNIEPIDLDNDNVKELVISVEDYFTIWKYELPPILPDLQIVANNITFSDPEPLENDTILISALIRNIGSDTAINVPVEFFLSDTSLANRLDSLSISSLPNGNQILVSTEWTPILAGEYSIFVMIDRENTINELDSTNNLSFRSLSVMDNDILPPVFLSHSHSEYLGDSDGLIEDDEFIRFDWQLFDESGIDSTWIYFNTTHIDGVFTGGDSFYNALNNQPPGIYPYEIHAIDNDNSALSAVVYDTAIIIQHAPHIISNYPLNNAIDVPLTDSIAVEFDIQMESASINSTTFLVFKEGTTLITPVSIIYYPESKIAVYEPGMLEPGTDYEAYLLSGSSGVKDLHGNFLESTYSWSFSTATVPLAANFSAYPVIAALGTSVAFTDLSTGNPTSWNWSFGDGSTSNDQNPLHEYLASGVYDVSLTVTASAQSDFVLFQDYITIVETCSMTVTSPNGGESWNAGSSYDITWNNNTSENVKIELFESGLNATTISGSTVNDGTYYWLIPSDLLSGNEYQIKISSVTNPSCFDFSENFSIIGTSPFACGNPFTDSRDGQIYSTVQIGNQCWMAENLNVGTMTTGTDNQINNDTIEKYCYNNVTDNCDVYGGLYQWNEAMQYGTTEGAQGICPDGWFFPSDADWKILEGIVDSQYPVGDSEWNSTGWRGLDAGGNLKETGTIHWNPPNTGATNSSGFTGLPGAYRYYDGLFGGLGGTSDYWTSTQGSSSGAYYRSFNYDCTDIFRLNFPKGSGFSVRCVRNISMEININSPNEGETWTRGSLHEITWTDNFTDNVRIVLYKSGTPHSVIAMSTESDGSYLWTLPSTITVGDDFVIKIFNVNNELCFDLSDSFTIEMADLLYLCQNDPAGWTIPNVPGSHSIEIGYWETTGGYDVTPMNLSTTTITSELLSNYEVVRLAIYWKQTFTEAEGTALSQWVNAGGKLLIDAPFQEHIELISDFGVEYIEGTGGGSSGLNWLYHGAPLVISPVTGPYAPVNQLAIEAMDRPHLFSDHHLTIAATIDGYPAVLYGKFNEGKVVILFNDGWSLDVVFPGNAYRACITMLDNQLFLQNVIHYFSTDLFLHDDLISNGESICFDTEDKMVVAGNGSDYIISDGGELTLVAGSSITLKPGFHAEQGSYFHAYIDDAGCSEPLKPITIITAETDQLEDPEPEMDGMVLTDDPSDLYSHLKVYPNPTTGKLNVEISSPDPADHNWIYLYDFQGRIIDRRDIIGPEKIEMDLSTSPAGVYIIRLVNGVRAETVKVVRQY